METNIIKRRIYLEPKYLDKNIMCHLLRTIEKKIIGEIDKEYGYIISANQIVKILHNENTTFVLKIEVKTYKPKIKQKIHGLVCGIFEEGIFVNVFGKVKILIPNIYIKDYTFDAVSGKYENNNKRIAMGDKIKVEIKAVRFDEGEFKCIGFLA